MSQKNIHQSYPEVIKRLKRAEGHIRTIVEMITEERPCLDIAQQMHAVEKALSAAKKTLIHDHIDKCLEDAVHLSSKEGQASIKEFKEITKYL